MLKDIRDERHQRLISEKIKGLGESPEQQGKPLAAELRGFRSIRAVGQRYRIVFRVARNERRVYIVAVGMRKEGSRRDVYRNLSRVVERIRRTFGW